MSDVFDGVDADIKEMIGKYKSRLTETTPLAAEHAASMEILQCLLHQMSAQLSLEPISKGLMLSLAYGSLFRSCKMTPSTKDKLREAVREMGLPADQPFDDL